MDAAARRALIDAVQANCDIADARHAADLTLCIYLLQMREFFRWEHALTFGTVLPREQIGTWIAAREARWEQMEDLPYRRVPVGGAEVDPLDAATVNAALAPLGLLYGAGLIGAGRPVFFLAERHAPARPHVADDPRIEIAGRELARGLTAPPAALADEQGDPLILLRRDALARWCWQRYEGFSLRPNPQAAFGRVVEAFELDRDFDAALPRWVELESELALLHEIGEWRIGRRLGAGWAELLLALPTRRGALLARALRDLLADLDGTLPALLDRDEPLAVHAWFAAFDGLREQLCPGLTDPYRAWRTGDRGAALHRACSAGRAHFEPLAEKCLRLHARGEHRAIEALLGADAAVCRG